MRLSQLPADAGLHVAREGAFDSLGSLTNDMPAMLTYLTDESFLAELVAHPTVTCVLTTPDLAGRAPERLGVATVTDPRIAFFQLHNLLALKTSFYGVIEPNDIAEDAEIHPTAWIAPGGVRIGRRTRIEARVSVFERTVIGDDCIIRSGVNVGVAGFEFKRLPGRAGILAVEHAGGVRLGNRVEIQGNSNVQPAIFGGYTEIGDDSKIDALVHVGHNDKIGRRCLVAAGTTLSGNVQFGDDVWIGPGCVISSGLHLGAGAHVTIGSVVTKDVEPGQRVTGNFAVPHERFLANLKRVAADS